MATERSWQLSWFLSHARPNSKNFLTRFVSFLLHYELLLIQFVLIQIDILAAICVLGKACNETTFRGEVNTPINKALKVLAQINAKPAARKTAPPISKQDSTHARRGTHGLPILVEDSDDDSNAVHAAPSATKSASKRSDRPATKAAGVDRDPARNDDNGDGNISSPSIKDGGQQTTSKRKWEDVAHEVEPAGRSKKRQTFPTVFSWEQHPRVGADTTTASSNPDLLSGPASDRRTNKQSTHTQVGDDQVEAAVQQSSEQAVARDQSMETINKNKQVASASTDEDHAINHQSKEQDLTNRCPRP